MITVGSKQYLDVEPMNNITKRYSTYANICIISISDALLHIMKNISS